MAKSFQPTKISTTQLQSPTHNRQSQPSQICQHDKFKYNIQQIDINIYFDQIAHQISNRTANTTQVLVHWQITVCTRHLNPTSPGVTAKCLHSVDTQNACSLQQQKDDLNRAATAKQMKSQKIGSILANIASQKLYF